jgi:hypothetical protein
MAARILHVSPDVFEQPNTTAVTVFLFDLVDPAEFDSHPSKRFLFGHPGANVALDLMLDVEAKFVIEILLDTSSEKERTKSNKPIGQHRPRYAQSRTWETTALSLRHVKMSASSRARPRRVSS